MSRKWSNWCQNEVDEETEGADCRDKERSVKMLMMMMAQHE